MPSSTPSSGSQSVSSTAGSMVPSAGAICSSGSNGAPYSGAHPSTNIRAMTPIVAAPSDASRSAADFERGSYDASAWSSPAARSSS